MVPMRGDTDVTIPNHQNADHRDLARGRYRRLEQARQITNDSLTTYNEERPHRSLGGMPRLGSDDGQNAGTSTFQLSEPRVSPTRNTMKSRSRLAIIVLLGSFGGCDTGPRHFSVEEISRAHIAQEVIVIGCIGPRDSDKKLTVLLHSDCVASNYPLDKAILLRPQVYERDGLEQFAYQNQGTVCSFSGIVSFNELIPIPALLNARPVSCEVSR